MFYERIDPSKDMSPWQNATDLGIGWKWLDWFGFFNTNNAPWIYHDLHGWLYPFQEPSGTVFWDADMNAFWWTNETTYPYVYRFSDGSWLFYEIGSVNPRWFYSFTTNRWEVD